MALSLTVAVAAFALIFPVEFPDKTFIATLVLATRYRPLLAWIGVSAAFLVQTAIAVTAGTLLATLPKTPVQAASAVLFLIGGVILLRGASKADEEGAEAEAEFEEVAAKKGTQRGWHAVATSFLVLFLAEWGDLSQILTANLVIRYQEPLSVGVGAWLALATVSGLAALLGKQLLKRVRLATIRRIGGMVCLLLAAITLAGLSGYDLPIG